MWILLTAGVTFVANAAVELVDLQIFPDRTDIEVLSLSNSENPDFSEVKEENEPSDKEDSGQVLDQLVIPTVTINETSDFLQKSSSSSDENLLNETETPDLTIEELVIETTTAVSSLKEDEESPDYSSEVLSDDTDTRDQRNENGEGSIREEESLENKEELDDSQDQTAEIKDFDNSLIVENKEEISPLSPLVGLAVDLLELRTGSEYRRKVFAGGQEPYEINVVEGNMPEGLMFDEQGQILGTPTTSGLFEVGVEVTDKANNKLFQLISLLIQEYKFISTSGGSVTVIITGETVTFFSALNSSGFEPAEVIDSGPLVVEIVFPPTSGDEISWVRCEVFDGVVCSNR